jgi:S-adenosylmethionine synthetase
LTLFFRTIDEDHDVELHINSAGPFFIGGPTADAGLTGRKIIADTYGGFAPHGGGAFSGKDPSKVDRSAAYMARHVAKSLVVNGYAYEALVQLSYAIGETQPFSIDIKSDSDVPEEELVKLVRDNFDLSPKGIIDYLKLNDPNVVKYKTVASGGHFLDPTLPWEQIKKF